MNEKVYARSILSRAIVRYAPGDSGSIEFFHYGKKEWVPDKENTYYGIYSGFDDSEVITEEEANNLIAYYLSGKSFKRGENWRQLVSSEGKE